MIDKPVLQPVETCYVTASGQKLNCLGKALMTLIFRDQAFEHEVIEDGVDNNLIGEDFISKYRCKWEHDESAFNIKGCRLPLEATDNNRASGRIIALETVLVPTGHEAVIKSGLSNRTKIAGKVSFVGILTPEKLFLEKLALILAKTLIDVSNEVIFTRVYNPGPRDVTVYKNTHMSILTSISRIGPFLDLESKSDKQKHINKVSEDQDVVPEHLKIVYSNGSKHLNKDQICKFRKFLCKHQNCFARPGQVGRTNMSVHKLCLKMRHQ